MYFAEQLAMLYSERLGRKLSRLSEQPQPHQPLASAPSDEISPMAFKEALAQVATAVTVVTTNGKHGLAGVTCSAVSAVSDTPATILVCINRKSYANNVIKENGVLCVNWLRANQSEVSQLFAGAGAVPMEQRFENGKWEKLMTGSPHSIGALISLDCRIVEAIEVETHTLFLARVVATNHSAGDPLIYCQRAYATTRSTH